MNVNFLKEISEAYVIDSGIEIDPDQIFEELYGIAKYLQTYDLDLYNELYESTKLQQQQILKRYLDHDYEQKVISEVYEYAILTTILTLLFGPSISKAANAALAWLGNSFETLGKFLIKHGKYSQLRYSIIQQNTQKCYAACGIKTSRDISALSYYNISSSSIMPSTEKGLLQGKCLRECYIEELREVIALHMENYFACLKRTGKFEVVQKTDIDDIMKLVSSTNISSACESYYAAAREALDDFYRILELVYSSQGEADLRFEQINKLRNKIYESRQTVQKVSDHQLARYDAATAKPQFNPQSRPPSRQQFNPRQR